MSDTSDIIDQASVTEYLFTRAALTKLTRYSGASLCECADCGSDIPAARRKAVPGVRLCVPCQEALDIEARQYAR